MNFERQGGTNFRIDNGRIKRLGGIYKTCRRGVGGVTSLRHMNVPNVLLFPMEGNISLRLSSRETCRYRLETTSPLLGARLRGTCFANTNPHSASSSRQLANLPLASNELIVRLLQMLSIGLGHAGLRLALTNERCVGCPCRREVNSQIW
jgi:hypothetical protein